MSYKRLWIALAIVIIGSFAVLGGVGVQMISNAPPIPQQVVTTDGHDLFDHDYIQNGQGVWQSLGGQEIGSIWGHGAYVAPDWTADYLHREATFILDRWAQNSGAKDYASLPEEQQATLRSKLERVPHKHLRSDDRTCDGESGKGGGLRGAQFLLCGCVRQRA
jgi:nitric oxide reductase subunit B